MKDEIYSNRYGTRNEKIKISNKDELTSKNYDLIFIGTPPDTYFNLIENLIKENPKAILVEKPLCSPNSKEINILKELVSHEIPIFVGNNHIVGPSVTKIAEILSKKIIGEIITMDVEFRENWSGIFDAHPWLDGPEDSYLGFWERGGSASGEHAHALKLWQF